MSKERDIIAEANKKLVLATIASAATVAAISAIVLSFTPLGEKIRNDISNLNSRVANEEQLPSTGSIVYFDSTSFEKRITELLNAQTESGSLNRAGLGIRYITINDETAATYGLPVQNGAFIPTDDSVLDGMPAKVAGLKAGDIIVKIDSTTINAENPLNYIIAKHAIGDSVLISYLRDGQMRIARIKLAKLSEQ